MLPVVPDELPTVEITGAHDFEAGQVVQITDGNGNGYSARVASVASETTFNAEPIPASQRDALAALTEPVDGMIEYDRDSAQFVVREGGAWVPITTRFNMDGTTTGRIRTDQPNLSNRPRRSLQDAYDSGQTIEVSASTGSIDVRVSPMVYTGVDFGVDSGYPAIQVVKVPKPAWEPKTLKEGREGLLRTLLARGATAPPTWHERILSDNLVKRDS